jgi:hypothetical protein
LALGPAPPHSLDGTPPTYRSGIVWRRPIPRNSPFGELVASRLYSQFPRMPRCREAPCRTCMFQPRAAPPSQVLRSTPSPLESLNWLIIPPTLIFPPVLPACSGGTDGEPLAVDFRAANYIRRLDLGTSSFIMHPGTLAVGKAGNTLSAAPSRCGTERARSTQPTSKVLTMAGTFGVAEYWKSDIRPVPSFRRAALPVTTRFHTLLQI